MSPLIELFITVLQQLLAREQAVDWLALDLDLLSTLKYQMLINLLVMRINLIIYQ